MAAACRSIAVPVAVTSPLRMRWGWPEYSNVLVPPGLCARSGTGVKTARVLFSRMISANLRSAWPSHEEHLGVKWKHTRGFCRATQVPVFQTRVGSQLLFDGAKRVSSHLPSHMQTCYEGPSVTIDWFRPRSAASITQTQMGLSNGTRMECTSSPPALRKESGI
jgi:hypothetical protein